MIEQKVKLVSEWLARAVDRRVFLRRMGGGVVAGVAALVMGPVLARSGMSTASASKSLSSPNISCAPPGPYCNNGSGDLSGCRGGHCYQHQGGACEIWYAFYTTGCWTTAVSGGYWTCCDCTCTTGSCGCASFNPSVTPSNNPSPH